MRYELRSANLSELSRRNFVSTVQPSFLKLLVGFIDLALFLTQNVPCYNHPQMISLFTCTNWILSTICIHAHHDKKPVNV